MKSKQPTTMIIINIVLFLDVLSDAGTNINININYNCIKGNLEI